MTRRTRAALAAAAAVFAFALTGCTGGTAPSPTPSASPSETTRPTGDAEPTQAIEFHPDGSAEDNLPFFDEVALGVIAANGSAGGHDFIDALVAGGFDKAAMQVTGDETTLGKPADSVQWSVDFAGECLIGQYGPASGGYHGVVRDELGTGGCLVGATRAIDW
ncbi:DUF6993 domain-containing protein [Agromyces seonyuensis]|uniref:DUF6993 domain-containing protein n=1 Tax=Agromyces seonyuensis TaxID=2662446 RepID=A0A6I4NTB7_9MICO|nr:hypothetical protein [Agromyces seonyuensis]MWB97371.1 hypothetical protein [Agromyces seonyuensis]